MDAHYYIALNIMKLFEKLQLTISAVIFNNYYLIIIKKYVYLFFKYFYLFFVSSIFIYWIASRNFLFRFAAAICIAFRFILTFNLSALSFSTLC